MVGEQALRLVLNAATSLPRHTAGFCFGQREYSPTVQRNLIESSIEAEIQQSSSGNMTADSATSFWAIPPQRKIIDQRNLNRYAQRYVASSNTGNETIRWS